jgi:hypothetical protein
LAAKTPAGATTKYTGFGPRLGKSTPCWLATVDQVTPLPLLVAQKAINQAHTLAQKDKNAAQKLVETAEFEVNRAMALGYARQDPEYAALKENISNLKKQLKGSEDTTSAFSKLKARLRALLKRESDRRTSSMSEQAPKKPLRS